MVADRRRTAADAMPPATPSYLTRYHRPPPSVPPREQHQKLRELSPRVRVMLAEMDDWAADEVLTSLLPVTFPKPAPELPSPRRRAPTDYTPPPPPLSPRAKMRAAMRAVVLSTDDGATPPAAPAPATPRPHTAQPRMRQPTAPTPAPPPSATDGDRPRPQSAPQPQPQPATAAVAPSFPATPPPPLTPLPPATRPAPSVSPLKSPRVPTSHIDARADIAKASDEFDTRHQHRVKLADDLHASCGDRGRAQSVRRRAALERALFDVRANRYFVPEKLVEVVGTVGIGGGGRRWTLPESIWGPRRFWCDGGDFWDTREVARAMFDVDWGRAVASGLTRFIERHDDGDDSDEAQGDEVAGMLVGMGLAEVDQVHHLPRSPHISQYLPRYPFYSHSLHLLKRDHIFVVLHDLLSPSHACADRAGGGGALRRAHAAEQPLLRVCEPRRP